jgi:hypothetical protein
MPGSTQVFSKYPNSVFVETGTYHGEGILYALQAGFKNIRSVELFDKLYHMCLEKFKNFPNVKLYQGNSSEKLWEMIANINEPITFWLDAHYSDSSTAKGPEFSPIIKELEVIKRHPINTHTILIDDIRDMGTMHFDFVTREQVIEKLMEINPNYTISYENGLNGDMIFYNDILVAKI